ncbi:MAG: glycosyltransferase [Solirubrobacterales bacterium]
MIAARARRRGRGHRAHPDEGRRRQPRAGAVLATDWYAEKLGAPIVGVDVQLGRQLPRWLVAAAESLGPLRGLLIARVARGFERVALVQGSPGTITFAVCERLRPGPPRLVLLEMIDRPRPRRPLRRLAYRGWFALIVRPALTGAVRRAHVLSLRERERYARRYGLEYERLAYVPWALVREVPARLPEVEGGEGVFASGRANCDWETVFAAARAGGWDLTVACGEADLERVEGLNRDGFARVLCEVPRSRHDQILFGTAVYVISVREAAASTGQVRLMSAVGAGVPVVASAVDALVDYIDDGNTGLTVPPEDPVLLRSAVDGLLADPARRRELREAALEVARDWTYADFYAAILDLIADREPRVPASLGGGEAQRDERDRSD